MSSGAFKGRDDMRRARELEEARKAGTIPAEKDDEGNEINPHIPQFMSQAPWYLNQDAPGLKHQRNLKEQKPVATATDFLPRGRKLGEAATAFRKGEGSASEGHEEEQDWQGLFACTAGRAGGSAARPAPATPATGPEPEIHRAGPASGSWPSILTENPY